MNASHIFTQYCDDVRTEADGRLSLMGLYPGKAIVTLEKNKKIPRICAHTFISIIADSDLNSLTMTTTWNGNIVGSLDIPGQAIQDFKNQRQEEMEGNGSLTINTLIEIKDLDIGQGGDLLTFVNINGRNLPSGKLRLVPEVPYSNKPIHNARF